MKPSAGTVLLTTALTFGAAACGGSHKTAQAEMSCTPIMGGAVNGTMILGPFKACGLQPVVYTEVVLNKR